MYRDQFGEFACGKNCKKKKQTKKQYKRKAVLHLTLSIATIVFLQNRKIPKISPSMYKPFQI